MVPTFHDLEYILTDKVSYRFSAPQRGDVVVFQAPKDHELDFIKRVIGLPGEKIKIQNGSVFIYNDKNPGGVKLNEPYTSDPYTSPGDFAKEGSTTSIAADQYFVMGDNRPRSSDSRVWGLVTRKEIVGRAWLRYWPLNKIKFIPGLKYGF
jgi:signal peptidase I